MSRFGVATVLTFVGTASTLLPWGWAPSRNFAVVFVAAYLMVFGLGVGILRLRFFGPVTCRGPVGAKVCALTFDDGPDASATEPLLALLRREDIQAAFFCIGSRVRERPDLARRVVKEGHLLENHTYHHWWWTNFLPTATLLKEVSSAQDAIRSATGVSPRYFRPPIGLMNPAVPRVTHRLGLHCVGWDVRSLDRGRIGTARVVRRIRRGLHEGSIVLLHDGGVDPQRLLYIVEQTIIFARSQGYRFVRLDQLLGHRLEGQTNGSVKNAGRVGAT